MKKVLLLLCTLLLSLTSLGQIIDGTQTPEQIPDAVAYRMLFKVLTKHPEVANNFARDMNLSQPGIFQLQDSLSTFAQTYQTNVVDLYPNQPSTAVANREGMVASVRSDLAANLSQDDQDALDAYVQNTVKSQTMYDPNSGDTYTGFYTQGSNPSDCDGNYCYDTTVGSFAESLYELDGPGFPCFATQVTSISFTGGNIWQSYDVGSAVLSQVSASLDGSVYGITSAGTFWGYDPVTQTFLSRAGSGLASIGVGNGPGLPTIWGVNTAHQVYTYSTWTNSWTLKTGTLTKVFVSPDGGGIWGIGTANDLKRWNGSSFVAITGKSVTNAAALSSTQIDVIGTDGKLYKYDQPTNTFTQIYTSAPVFTKIGARAPGYGALLIGLYGIKSDGTVWNCALGQSCTQVTNAPASNNIAVASPLDVITIDTAGHVKRYIPTLTQQTVHVVNPDNYMDYSDLLTYGNMPRGTSFQSGGETHTNANNCNASFVVVFAVTEKWAYTKNKNIEFGLPGHGCHPFGYPWQVQTNCKWNVTAWCVSPNPIYRETEVTDEANEGKITAYWRSIARCWRLSPAWPWSCKGFVSLETEDASLGDCDHE